MPLYSTETEAQKRKCLPRPALRAEHDSIHLFLPPQGAFVYPGSELSQNRKDNIWRRQCLRDYKAFITPGEHSSWKENENRGGWGRTEESVLFSGSTQLEIGLQITVILNKYSSHLRGLKGGLWPHRLCWGSKKCYDENCLSTAVQACISSTREAMVGTPYVLDQPGLQRSILPQKHKKTNHSKKCTHQTFQSVSPQ